MTVDLRVLPPVAYDTQTNRPIYSALAPELRAKWKRRWAQMDSEGKGSRHYSRHEWDLRKTFTELETREEQLDACIRKGPQ